MYAERTVREHSEYSLPKLSLRANRPAGLQDSRCNRRNEVADAKLLKRIIAIISDMPGYGYRQVGAILRKRSRNDGLPLVNAKRVYRVLSENGMLLLYDKPKRPQREHNGKVAVA